MAILQLLDHSALVAVNCNLCGEDDAEYLYSKTGRMTGYAFRLVRCRNCGLLYLNPRLNESAIRNLYDQSYYAGKGFDPAVRYAEDYQEAADDHHKLFKPDATVCDFQYLVPAPAKLLDYGCGLGDLIRQAIKHSYQADGYEISEFASNFAAREGNAVFTDPDRIPVNYYDIITAIEVLEHSHNPLSTLRTVYKCLKPGGVFYYTTANFDGFYENWKRGIQDTRDGYIVPEGHIYFFSTQVICSYLYKVGFSDVFDFRPPAYQKASRLYRLLCMLRLINKNNHEPVGLHEKALYYGGRRLVDIVRGGNVRLLPLARK